MHGTRSLIDTRRRQTHNGQNHSKHRTEQHSLEIDHSEMNNYDNNAGFFRIDGQLRYHWGADDDIMTFIDRREKSPETAELVRRRIDLARPGAMKPLWNKNLCSEIYLPKRPEENERREIKRIDLQLKRKKETPTLAEAISKTSETKYRKHNHKNNNNRPTPKKTSKTTNSPPQTTPKMRWRHMSPGLPSNTGPAIQGRTDRRNHYSAQASFLLLFVEFGTRKLRKVVESRTKFTFDVERVLDSTTVPVLDSTPILLL